MITVPAPRCMRLRLALLVVAAALAGAACSGGASPTSAPSAIVVTFPVLGTVVRDLVGDRAVVTVLMPDGVDPHDWSPSAKDIERVMGARLVVANGLGLEANLANALTEAEKAGVPVFRATDHITVRPLEDDGATAADPHFWVDPLSMRDVVAALVPELATVGIDVAARGTDLEQRLADLDAEIRATLAVVPEADRKLVTGHESMGYFAARYGFALVGAVIPGLTSQGEASAGEMAALATLIREQGVKAIFAEIGTPSAVAEAIARETGVAVVELPSHTLPADGSYFSFVRAIATSIAGALR
jgi:zinc/manganese transport system substrate-binding protein